MAYAETAALRILGGARSDPREPADALDEALEEALDIDLDGDVHVG